MIRSIVHAAWAESPLRVILAIPAALLTVLVVWGCTVAYLVGLS